LAILSVEHSETVWFGFVKTCVAFHERYPESIPLHVKHKADLLKFLKISEEELVQY
jgi:hypothetical protein